MKISLEVRTGKVNPHLFRAKMKVPFRASKDENWREAEDEFSSECVVCSFKNIRKDLQGRRVAVTILSDACKGWTYCACTPRLWLICLHVSFFCFLNSFLSFELPFRLCMVVPVVSPTVSLALLTQVFLSGVLFVAGEFALSRVSEQNYLPRPTTGRVTTSKHLRVTISTVS